MTTVSASTRVGNTIGASLVGGLMFAGADYVAASTVLQVDRSNATKFGLITGLFFGVVHNIFAALLNRDPRDQENTKKMWPLNFIVSAVISSQIMSYMGIALTTKAVVLLSVAIVVMSIVGLLLLGVCLACCCGLRLAI